MIPQLSNNDLQQWLAQVQAEIFAAELVVGMYEWCEL